MVKLNLYDDIQDIGQLIEHMAHGFAYCRMHYENDHPINFTYLLVNPAFGIITGLNGVVGKKVTEVIPNIWERNPELFEIYGRVALTGRSERFESYVPELSKWFAVTAYSPKRGYFVATFEDITHRKNIENTLQKSESNLKAMVDNSPLLTWLKDSEGRYILLNRKFADFLQLKDAQSAIGKNDFDLHPEELAEKYRSDDVKVMETQCSLRTKEAGFDGKQTVWVETFKAPIFDEVGKVVGTVGFANDITDRKKNEERLQLARLIFETASEPIFVSDLDGNLLDVNDAACRLAKYTQEEMLRLRNVDIVAQNEIARIDPELEKCDTGDVAVNRWNLLCSDGSTVPLELVVQRIPGNRYMAIGRDLTERDRVLRLLSEARDIAEAANLSKTRFLAAAGHDLRQPLAATNLFIDALKFTDPTSDQNQIIQRLDQAMSNFNDLLNALLNVSKLDAGIIKPELVSITVGEIFNWLEESFAPMVSQKNLQFKLYFPIRNPLVVLCDLGLFKSVLMNLVSNAIKFTERGGILVSARQRGEDVLFQVWDTGIGISEEYIEKVFDDFYQIDNQQRDRTNGLGLGLSIAKRAMALFDGEIACRSQVGRGSVFMFHLPIDDIHDNVTHDIPISKSSELKADRSFVQGKFFFVLEDDTMVSEALSKSLAMMGGKVECFDNAETALEHPNIGNADCYIVDYMLSGEVDGVNFLLRLHQQLQKYVCAVMMSGNTSTDFVSKTEFFAWPVVHKPVNISKLITKLAEQYGKSV